MHGVIGIDKETVGRRGYVEWKSEPVRSVIQVALDAYGCAWKMSDDGRGECIDGFARKWGASDVGLNGPVCAKYLIGDGCIGN